MFIQNKSSNLEIDKMWFTIFWTFTSFMNTKMHINSLYPHHTPFTSNSQFFAEFYFFHLSHNSRYQHDDKIEREKNSKKYIWDWKWNRITNFHPNSSESLLRCQIFFELITLTLRMYDFNWWLHTYFVYHLMFITRKHFCNHFILISIYSERMEDSEILSNSRDRFWTTGKKNLQFVCMFNSLFFFHFFSLNILAYSLFVGRVFKSMWITWQWSLNNTHTHTK